MSNGQLARDAAQLASTARWGCDGSSSLGIEETALTSIALSLAAIAGLMHQSHIRQADAEAGSASADKPARGLATTDTTSEATS